MLNDNCQPILRYVSFSIHHRSGDPVIIMTQKPTLMDYLQLHFIVLIWGFTAILGKLLQPLDASAVVLFRTLLAIAGHWCHHCVALGDVFSGGPDR
jgi:hypothetical protein